jgi:DNA ligase-1
MKPQTLYRKGKAGQMIQWTIWTDGPEIFTEYGQVGGKMQVATKIAKGKNIGRSNETSPADQAEKEARAMHKKRLDEKYSYSTEAARDPVFLPMLAHDFEKRKKKVVYPADVQPKLDGFRCMAKWEGSTVVLRTRSGKEVRVPHIEADLAKFLPDDKVADGEIYLHGATFQTVSRLIKKYRPGETEALQLWIYDMFDPDELEAPWRSRRALLECTFAEVQRVEVPALVYVGHLFVTEEREVYIAQESWLKEGYEGGVLRQLDGGYNLGHRSHDLLKIKKFVDEEFTIVGHESGRGKFSDCVIWICKTPDGQKFSVVPKGTLVQKRAWFDEAQSHYGKLLKVKYFEKSEAGVPRFPVGLGFRDKE